MGGLMLWKGPTFDKPKLRTRNQKPAPESGAGFCLRSRWWRRGLVHGHDPRAPASALVRREQAGNHLRHGARRRALRSQELVEPGPGLRHVNRVLGGEQHERVLASTWRRIPVGRQPQFSGTDRDQAPALATRHTVRMGADVAAVGPLITDDGS